MNSLPRIEPVRPKRHPAPFDRKGWLFELKYDGFRAVAYIQHGRCKLISRNNKLLSRFPSLNRTLPAELDADSAILDGEIVVLDRAGVSRFDDLAAGKGRPTYAAFDLLWLNNADLRNKPLIERKRLLEECIKKSAGNVLFVAHIEEQGRALYGQACALDLEGIVAKSATASYSPKAAWYKIKNPNYTQARGRAGRFSAKRKFFYM